MKLSIRAGKIGILSYSTFRVTMLTCHISINYKCVVVPRSGTDFCASLFTVMLKDSVLLRL